MSNKIKVLQDGYKDCAVASLLSIIRYYNGNISKEELSYVIKTSKTGTNAFNMIEGMKSFGFDGYGMHYTKEEILHDVVNIPFIAHVKCGNYYHFIVIYEINIRRKYLKVMDPAFGIKKISFDLFSDIYLGSVIILYPVKKIPNVKENNRLMSYLFNTLRINKKVLITIILLSILSIIFTIISGFYFKIIIDYLLIYKSIKLLIISSIIFIVIVILKDLINLIKNNIVIKIKEYVSNTINNDVIRHLISLPYQYLKSKPTGELVSRIDDLEVFKELITNVFVSNSINVLLILNSLIVLIIISYKLLIIIIFIIILYSLIIVLYNKRINNKIIFLMEEEGLYKSNLTEVLSSFETIKNLGIEKNFLKKLEMDNKSLNRNIKNFEKILSNQMFCKDIIYNIGLIIVLMIGSLYIINNSMTIGDLVVFYSLMSLFVEPIRNILDNEITIKYAFNSYKRIESLLMIKNNDEKYSNKKIKGPITMNNLSYSYNGIDKVVDHITLYINTHVLIYGDSGSGKSTIAKILLKHINDYGGSIYINDNNYLDIDSSIIKNSFTYVSQEECLFTNTLKNNIVCLRNIRTKEYENVLKICHVDKIRDNKKFRDLFLIEENGFNLSGGERQKIVLARALLKNSNYIILDEALSEVEVDEEIEIINNIKKYYKNSIIIYISHKERLKKEFDFRYEINRKEKNV